MKSSSPIAITGGTGFIGGALAEACLADGRAVRLLVRSVGERAQALRTQGAVLIEGDLHDTAALNALCQDAHSVVHCAAEMGKRDADKSTRINVEGTQHVLTAAARGGVQRFQYVSSISVYRGTSSATRVFTEAHSPFLHPKLNNYSRTKLEGEHLVQAFCQNTEMDYVIVRPTNVYGPGCRPWGREVEDFVKRFRISFGRVPFNFIHIADLVDAMCLALDTDEAANETFNFGTEMIPLCEFQEYIAHTIGASVMRVPRLIDATIRHSIDSYGRLSGEVRSTAYTVHAHYPHTKAKTILGYGPKHRIKETATP
ncbi:MAG: NAD(P)-dependent oxidoreductase [Myxococcota bacterium]|nr:NAD(P)-dependent oxidoreductase [Myxococcota bacterium]